MFAAQKSHFEPPDRCNMAAVPQLVETVKDLSELATLSMQAMIIFDDFDDKVTEKDGLLQRMNLSKAQVDGTLQGLRDIMNAAHRARDQASEEICQITSDDGVKPKVLAPQMTRKDMERLWQREEGEPKEAEAEEEETKDEEEGKD